MSGLVLLVLALLEPTDAAGEHGGMLIGGGLVFLTLGVFLPWLKSFNAGPVGVATRDRDALEGEAAARAAEAQSPEAIEAWVGSDDLDAPSPSDEDPDVVGILNYQAGVLSIEAILHSVRVELNEDVVLDLFLYDAEQGRLRSVTRESATAWRPGQGATGVAYLSKKIVTATGSAVYDSTYGVPEDQREQFKRLTMVTAVPVFNGGGDVIAVFTACSSEDESALATEAGQEELMRGALLLSRVLVELLQWFDDDY